TARPRRCGTIRAWSRPTSVVTCVRSSVPRSRRASRTPRRRGPVTCTAPIYGVRKWFFVRTNAPFVRERAHRGVKMRSHHLLRYVALAGVVALVVAGPALVPAGASAPSAASSCTVKIGMIFAGGGSQAANEKGSGDFAASATDQQTEDMNQVAFDDINK